MKIENMILTGRFETLEQAEQFIQNKLNLPNAVFVPVDDNEAVFDAYSIDNDAMEPICFETEYGWLGYTVVEEENFKLHTEIHPR